ncbi:phosphotransferase family protein, partial [Rhizobiaceae sp. 2RAB30]
IRDPPARAGAHFGPTARVAAPDWPATGVDKERVARLLDIMLDLTNHCPEEWRLIHGDFGSNNVLTDGRCITGVIDWSEAMYGDPLYDVANILSWRSWVHCMEEQARHLEHSGRLGNPDRLRCYQLRIGLAEIYENAVAGTDENVSWALARCETIALAE